MPNPPATRAADANPPEVTILALDPSAACTGVVLVRFPSAGPPRLLAHASLSSITPHTDKADAETAFFARLADIRHQLCLFVSSLTSAIDYVACEYPQTFGGGASAAWGLRPATADVQRCVGALCTIAHFRGVPIRTIGTQTAAAVYKGNGLKKAQKKAAAIRWANYSFSESLDTLLLDDQDAIADAMAVSVACYRKLRAEQIAAMQAPLPGLKAPTRKRAVKA